MAAELPYWIEEFNSHYVIWTKVDLPASSTTTIYIIKREGYSPNPEEVFLFFDDFYDLSKWDPSLALGSFEIQPSFLRMWKDWGGCCDGHCYYHGLATNVGFSRPFIVEFIKTGEFKLHLLKTKSCNLELIDLKLSTTHSLNVI